MSHYKGGELLGKGSYGCVFSPSIPCNSSRKPDPKQVSKVFFHSKSKEKIKQEYAMNQLIRKITGHERWAVTMETRCKPPPYQTMFDYDPSILVCLENAKKTSEEFDKTRSMLIGDKSETTLYSYFIKHYTYQVISQPKVFTRMFVETMKLFDSLFVGLCALHQSKICHLDIKDDNIVLDKGSLKYIDFGLAGQIQNQSVFKQRSEYVFQTNSVYVAYPLEFIFLFASKSKLHDELQRIHQGNLRNYFMDYQYIHEFILGRPDPSKYPVSLLQTMISQKPPYREVIRKIDTYSLGMLLPSLLHKVGVEYDMYETVLRLIQLPKVKPFMKLFKLMTDPDCKSRISPKQARELYLKLKSRYLQRKQKKTRRDRKKRTTKKKHTTKKRSKR